MEMLQGVWKQHLRPRAVVGYGLKIFLPSPPNYVTRSPGLTRTSLSRVSRMTMSGVLLTVSFHYIDTGNLLKKNTLCGWRNAFKLSQHELTGIKM